MNNAKPRYNVFLTFTYDGDNIISVCPSDVVKCDGIITIIYESTFVLGSLQC